MHSRSDRGRGLEAMAELSEPVLTSTAAAPTAASASRCCRCRFPAIADDFDWRARDYDSFRLFMMQELAYRFPDRRRWTPADIEVVIVELLAAALDRASHALDAVHGRALSRNGAAAAVGAAAAQADRLRRGRAHRPGDARRAAAARPTTCPRRRRAEARALLAARSGGDGGGARRRAASDRRAAPHGDARRPRDAADDPPAGRARPRAGWSGAARGARSWSPRCSRTTAASTIRCMSDRRRCPAASRASVARAALEGDRRLPPRRAAAAAAGRRQPHRAPLLRGDGRALPHGRLGGAARSGQVGADHLHALGARQARLFPLRAEAGARRRCSPPTRAASSSPAGSASARICSPPTSSRRRWGSRASRSPASTASSASGPGPTGPATGVIEIADDEFALCLNDRTRAARRARWRLIVNAGEVA